MRSVAIVCVRALAAYLILINANYIAMALGTRLSLGDSRDILNAPLVGFAMMIAVGVAMLVWSKTLAGLAVQGVTEAGPASPDSRAIIHIGTALLGIFFIATALPELASALWRYFAPWIPADRQADAQASVQRGLAISSLIQAVVGIIVGSLLLILSRGISNLGLFRASTTPPAASPPPSRA